MNLSNDFFYAVIIHSAVIIHPAMINLPAVISHPAVIKQRTKGINKKDFRQLDKHVRPDNK
ncbi:hypothetical protein RCO48_19825 [Peribacillus frigoritolerans]|nr:hypothetical protein [Peribacillus frigoritolerans]